MPPRRAPQVSSNEADIQRVISSIEAGQIQSESSAASIYSVPHMTMRDRRAGRPARRDCQPNSKKLTKREEEVIISYILHLDQRGFAPTYAAVRDMADKLLAARGAGQVGVHWPRNFVQRTDSLKTCFNRAYDRQRALCENPALIRSWFELIEETKAKYGICDKDVYNFDEAGFIMGKITTQLVVTASERRGRPKAIQPGNREWVTLIAAINAAGWSVPPFLIFAGQYHLSAWYEEAEIPRDWAIAVSDNGWTNNKLGVEWLKHFNAHTQARSIGARRLLIIDGHKSHQSLEFQELCKENNIHTLCMPPHSSHLLQPLDVGCFSPLKRAYSREVESLMRNHINHITKLEFLPAFKIAFDRAFTPANICSAFRGSGLVPLQPEAVLSKLDVQLRTPTPPAALPEAPWVAQTPSNARELEAQSSLIRERVRQHKSSSPASIIEAIDQLKKGAEVMMLSAELMRDRISSLERANSAASARRRRSKRRIQKHGVLTKGTGEDILAQNEANQQIAHEERQGGARSGLSQRAQRRCTRCKETGHNSRTCKTDTIDIE
ncbi:DDE superfamily endonuclease [Pyrenophora tritici-repentis]|nr:DDE superfamily endonuclease [Pyrenophora tritici-repentis]